MNKVTLISFFFLSVIVCSEHLLAPEMDVRARTYDSGIPCQNHFINGKLTVFCRQYLGEKERTLRQELLFHSLGGRFMTLNLSNNNRKKNKVAVKKRVKQEKCLKEIIQESEECYQIPKNLLLSIAKVETGMRPYVINYNGRGWKFNNLRDAVAFAKNLIQNGQTNFSVGCFQLHYRSHARHFRSIEDMFKPEKNAEYAAKLLKRLYRSCGYNWECAIKRYHSGYEAANCIYYSKIVNKLGRCV